MLNAECTLATGVTTRRREAPRLQPDDHEMVTCRSRLARRYRGGYLLTLTLKRVHQEPSYKEPAHVGVCVQLLAD
jgi:hypothetical protein